MTISSAESQISDESYLLGSKCGTFMPNRNSIIRDRKLAEINQYNRPELQKSQLSISGRFLVHFDTTGFNAVELIDKNNNDIPDYIDSVCYYFDYVHQKEVQEIGYLSPAQDNNKGGSDAFDIYILNIGVGDIDNSGLYGYTIPEDEIPGSKPNRLRYTAYIVIDNDFSSLDSSYTPSNKKYRTFYDTSYTALKITAAHEYHHAVQFMYGEDVLAPSMNELSSTWFEYRLFPETKDYMQYVKVLFKNPSAYPFGKGVPTTGYLYGIFGQYLYHFFGDNALLRMWQLIADGNQSYDALNKTLIEKGTELSSEWCKFTGWLYHTGKRAKDGDGFDSSAIFPTVTFFKDEAFQNPSYSNSAGLLSFEFRFFRVRFPSSDINTSPDTLDLLLTSTDLKSAVFQSDYEMPYILTAVDQSMTDYSRIGNTNYYFRLEAPKGNLCYTPLISNGEITKSICYAYPNPFIQNIHNSIMFPSPHDSQIGSMVTVNLYNSELQNVYSGKLAVAVDNSNRVLSLDFGNLNITSGVYIFEVGDNNECRGKIAIIKSK